MERMIIKHTSGSKANQVEEFPLNHYSELILGRDVSSTVKYDPDRDDLVGREHAKITRDPNNPEGFLIEDTASKNGTFLNGQKLTGVQTIRPGDVVQLGSGGPEFTFDVEPRPLNATKPTRIADVSTGGKVAPETRIADAGSIATGSVATAPGGKAVVGKATVERMISSTVTETKKQEGKKYATIGIIAGLCVLVLVGLVAGGLYWNNARQQAALQSELNNKSSQLEAQSANLKSRMEEDKANGGISAAEVSDKYGKSVVYIQGSWELINKESKSQIYHQFMPNSREALTKLYKKDYGKGPIIEGGGAAIPIYLQTQDGYEPALTDQKTDLSQAIGGEYTCSGFIVTTDGFILTNRHCSSPWKSDYDFPDNYPKGILIGQDGQIAGAGVDPPKRWIPDNTKAVPRQFQQSFDGVQKLSIMLPGTDNPIEAQKVQDSPRHDVGMLKVSVPGNLPKVELYDAYDTLRKGEGLVIMGYPASAPSVYSPIKSQNFLNKEGKATIIPDPTVSVTSVGNITKNSDPNDQANIRISSVGDTIRYAGGLTYAGNSGGPVFDMQGRVIAIHFAGVMNGDVSSSAMAVPIRYGLQLFPGGQ
jgi:pSer/pThr/pTyr-binding forkhead associated (FHA) protein